jgi:hypothetical protein
MTTTDKLIQELSQLFADNSYSKEFIKERLDNLAAIAAIEGKLEQEQKRINATYPLGAVGLIEPDQLNNNEDYQL